MSLAMIYHVVECPRCFFGLRTVDSHKDVKSSMMTVVLSLKLNQQGSIREALGGHSYLYHQVPMQMGARNGRMREDGRGATGQSIAKLATGSAMNQ